MIKHARVLSEFHNDTNLIRFSVVSTMKQTFNRCTIFGTFERPNGRKFTSRQAEHQNLGTVDSAWFGTGLGGFWKISRLDADVWN